MVDVEFQGGFFELKISNLSSIEESEKFKKHVFLPLFDKSASISPTQSQVIDSLGDSFIEETILYKPAVSVSAQISPFRGQFLFFEKKKSISFLVSAGSLIKKFYIKQSTRGFRSFFQRKKSHKTLQTGS